MIIVLYGPPGSGKGCQSQKLESLCGFTHLSTGNLLREELSKQTELGKKIASVMREGKLVSNEIVSKLVENYIDDHSSEKIIFDGYPRNLDQAKELDVILTLRNQKIDKVIKFDITFETLVERILSRIVCADCGKVYNTKLDAPKKTGECDSCHGNNLVHRNDDTEEVIKDRVNIFENETSRVLEYYSSQGKLSRVNAQQNIDNIFSQLLETIGKENCKGVK